MMLIVLLCSFALYTLISVSSHWLVLIVMAMMSLNSRGICKIASEGYFGIYSIRITVLGGCCALQLAGVG